MPVDTFLDLLAENLVNAVADAIESACMFQNEGKEEQAQQQGRKLAEKLCQLMRSLVEDDTLLHEILSREEDVTF
jgi:hypothetical protein